MTDIFEDYIGKDRGESDEHYQGWLAAREMHQSGVDISTHRSQGLSEWDEGWNDYIEEVTR
jgi:hypothetical protein